MNKHTPGPWIASLGEYAFTNSGQRAVTTDAGDDEMPVHIAFVSTVADRKRSTPYNAPDPERDANARLIAAAPDLLEALRPMTEGLAWLTEAHVDAARAAIAKATGA